MMIKRDKQFLPYLFLFTGTLLMIGIALNVLSRLLTEVIRMVNWPAPGMIGTTLVAGAIAIFFTALLVTAKEAFIHKTIDNILKRPLYLLLLVVVLFTLILPTLLSQFLGTTVSPIKYLHQLWLAVIAMLSIVVTTWILTRRIPELNNLLFYSRMEAMTVTQQQDEVSFNRAEAVLNMAYEAFEADRISEAQLKEIEQISSLIKWIVLEDEAGWHELWEEIYFGGQLQPTPRAVVKKELQRMQLEEAKLEEYAGRLRLLLLSQFEAQELGTAIKTASKSRMNSPKFVHSDEFVSEANRYLQYGNA